MSERRYPYRALAARRRRPAATEITPAELFALQTEAEFQAQVVECARLNGWRFRYHAWDPRHSEEGWPDLHLMRPPAVLVAELKRVGEQPTEVQQDYLEAFRACGIAAYWWTPLDWGDVERVLGAREEGDR